MSEGTLVRSFKLDDAEKSRLGGLLGKIKSVGEFLADAGKAFKGTQLIEVVKEALPWAEAAGEALSETIPPVKFLATFFSKLTEVKDPATLALFACTLAYQRSVEQALTALEAPIAKKKAISEGVLTDLRQRDSGEMDFRRLSFGDALQHPFIHDADSKLTDWANAVGYGPDQQRLLINEIHQRFVSNLKTILSHGDTRQRFAPLAAWMSLGTGDAAAYEALADHAEYQRWLFEEQPVFGQEPFALTDIYVDTECGSLSWGAIRDGMEPGPEDPPGQRKRVDPFSEEFGSRQPLSQTVLELLGNPKLKDAVVIQGVAGAGKSAFTLWLCSELVRQGLRPIRVLLRDLRLEKERPVAESLMEAVRITDEKHRPDGLPYPRPEDLFLKQSIFRQRVCFGKAWICPYVLILDGWDEISVSVTEGFKQRVGRMLERLRSEFLHDRDEPLRMRVILTGRPSEAVTDSTFLYKETPILTIRPLSPDQLEQLGRNLAQNLKSPRRAAPGSGWSSFEPERLEPVLRRYREELHQSSQQNRSFELDPRPEGTRGSLEVLGLPLLAYLAIRLLSEPQADMGALLDNPTTLYRSLVDLTCGKSGKFAGVPEEIDHQYRISGERLRKLLWRTAGAMTVYGGESISFQELRLRLRQSGDELSAEVKGATEDRLLSQLMISYYFKGGNPDLGCEFLHKSFREYLLAEGIVEILKDYGRQQRQHLPERPATGYWKEFERTDPRYRLSRELSLIISPQWLRPEVTSHLHEILRWEIGRANKIEAAPALLAGQPTEPLDLNGWHAIRNALADLWDWWAEGVHLRPQPDYNQRQEIILSPPYAQELVEWSMPLDYQRGATLPTPSRFTAIDAHMGDALFCISCQVHFQIAVKEGWLYASNGEMLPPLELWREASEIGAGPRRHQTTVPRGETTFILFYPSGKSPDYFENYSFRINGAGWRPLGAFPLGFDLSGIDLRSTSIRIPIPFNEPRGNVNWAFANLCDAKALGSLFYRHIMTHVLAQGAVFWNCMISRADLTDSDYRKSKFSSTSLDSTNLTNTDLSDANLYKVDFARAKLENTDLSRADVSEGNLDEADLVSVRGEPHQEANQLSRPLALKKRTKTF